MTKHAVGTAYTSIPTTANADLLSSCVSLQADAREMVLRIMDKSGLVRTQEGTALLLTVRGVNEEVTMDDIGKMPLGDLAKLYTVTVENRSTDAAFIFLSFANDSSTICIRSCNVFKHSPSWSGATRLFRAAKFG